MSEHVHEWFELSRANYLTVPRIALESMPEKWQERFVKCLEELDNSLDWRPEEGRYRVELQDEDGNSLTDPLQEYRHAPKLSLKPGHSPEMKDNCYHVGNCDLCGAAICEECQSECVSCEKMICDGCKIEDCDSCGEAICQECCGNSCDNCRVFPLCSHCVKEAMGGLWCAICEENILDTSNF